MAGLSLITGATGFAGSHLLDQLLEREPAVAAWSNPRGKPPSERTPNVHWSVVDLLDRDAVRSAIADLRPGVVYHCAGAADVGSSWSDPVTPLRLNTLGTHYLLDAIRSGQISCRIVVVGSAAIYAPSTQPLGEESPTVPANPYGVSKLAQELIAARAEGARVLLARPFNHAGPRQSTAYVTSSFARQIAEIEAGLTEPMIRVGNLDARRDITDVRDTVRAYRMLAEAGRAARPYNVCSGTAYRIGDLLDMLLGFARERIAVSVDPARLRPSDNPVIAGDASRLRAETGWAPAIPIERTLGDLLDYWRLRTAVPRL